MMNRGGETTKGTKDTKAERETTGRGVPQRAQGTRRRGEGMATAEVRRGLTQRRQDAKEAKAGTGGGGLRWEILETERGKSCGLG